MEDKEVKQVKYTSGPWSPGLQGASVVADRNNAPDPANKNDGHNDFDYYGGYLIAESISSNADVNLIAAAPELLECCKTILDKYRKELWSNEIELLNKAISKAEGR